MSIPDGAVRRSNAVVAVDDLTFGVDLADGTRWDYDKLTGWWDSPSSRSRVEDRPGQDGAFTADPLYTRRFLTIAGTVRAASRGAAVRSAQAVAAIGRRVIIGVDDPDLGYLWCEATRLGVDIDASGAGMGLFRYSLTFEASDPRKYGSPQIISVGRYVSGTGGLSYPLVYPLVYGTPGSGGIVEVTNYGTAPTEPLITVSSPVDFFTVTHVETGRDLSYYNSASALQLDSYQGRATENGEDRTRWLLSRQWFQIQPGQTATFGISTALGGAWTVNPLMTVSMAPAYW